MSLNHLGLTDGKYCYAQPNKISVWSCYFLFYGNCCHMGYNNFIMPLKFFIFNFSIHPTNMFLLLTRTILCNSRAGCFACVNLYGYFKNKTWLWSLCSLRLSLLWLRLRLTLVSGVGHTHRVRARVSRK